MRGWRVMIQGGVLYGLGTMFGFGLADFLAKKAIGRSGYVAGVLYIQLAGLVPLLLYPGGFGGQQVDAPFLGAAVIVSAASAFTTLTFFRGIEVGKLSIVSPLGSAWPLLVFPYGIVILGELLTISKVLGALLATVGILMTVFRSGQSSVSGGESGARYGLLALVGSAVMFVSIKLFVRDFNPVLLALAMRPLAAAMILCYGFLSERGVGVQDLRTGILLAFAGMADGFAFLSYSLGVRTQDISLVAPVASCAPLVAILLARIFFRERITQLQKVGVASVVAGIVALSIV